MSGGSFNYLFIRGGDDIWEHIQDVEEMANDLAQLGYADDAARETTELLLIMRQSRVRADVIIKRLNVIWHNMEWWRSMDSGEDGVKEALELYRKLE